MSLDSWLQIDEQRVSRGRIIPCRVRFELDAHNLAKIYRVYDDNSKIVISSNKLTNLRFYVFLASQTIEESSLVFATSYLQNEQKATIVKSIISLEGKVTQQIQQDAWYSFQIRNKVIPLHHWLIWQILQQLSFKTKDYSQLIAVVMSLSIVTLLLPIIWTLLAHIKSVKLLLIFAIWVILQYLIKYLLEHQFKSWISQELLCGFLSSKVKRRAIGLKILSILG